MTLFHRHAGLMSCAAFALTAAGSALAAEPAKPEQKIERRVVVRMGPGEEGPMGHGMMMGMMGDPAARAARLRDILQLRPDQEPALKALLDASGPMAHGAMGGPGHGDMEGHDDGAMAKPLTTPERLDRQLERMSHHQMMFKKHAEAVKAFYAVLSPTQKKAFDALHPGPGPGKRRMRMIHRGPMGSPMGGPPAPGAADPHAGHGGMAMMEGDEDIEFMLSGLDMMEDDLLP